MKEKNKLADVLYVGFGVLIFSVLAYWMFINFFNYIKMDYATLCKKEGGTWHAFSQECIKQEDSN